MAPATRINRPLFHFTCDHGRRGIDHDGGLIVPRFQPVLGLRAVWMTDDPGSKPAALGLQLKRGSIITCDRMTHRFRIDQPRDIVPWSVWRDYVPRDTVHALESVHGTRPDSWYLTARAQHGEID